MKVGAAVTKSRAEQQRGQTLSRETGQEEPGNVKCIMNGGRGPGAERDAASCARRVKGRGRPRGG